MSEKSSVNKEGWIWNAPDYFNKWRIFPRAFVIFYFWLAYEVAIWFMGLAVPGPAQAAFSSAVMAAGAAWFGLYVNSGSAKHTVTVQTQQSGTKTDQGVKG